MKSIITSALSAIILFVFIAGPAQATLLTIGQVTYGGSDYNLIYDNDAPFGSVIWLDYTHASVSWRDQMSWANSLNMPAVLEYTFILNSGYSLIWDGEWRLPSTIDGPYEYGYDGSSTFGFNITSSEMGHLFYNELGNLGYYDLRGSVNPDYGLVGAGPFQNLKADMYWTETTYAVAPFNAWVFTTATGSQDVRHKGGGYHPGLAVRSGRLEITPVPEPSTLLLLVSGLGVIVSFRKKFRS